MKLLPLLLLCLTFASGLLAAEPVLELQGTDGKMHAPLVAGEKKAVLLVFVSPFCSTTRPFMPEINAIAAEYADRVAVHLVHSDSEITVEVALQHADMNKVVASVLVDKEQKLARQVGAAITPEAVLLSPAGAVLYKGRINDLYLGPTKRQRAATTKDLRDALDAVLSGKPVATPQPEAQGCKIGGLK
ncbi:thioredoxin domain-containing protein [Prosthecobacter dejongeii]|uniref:Thiol-disulfide isomerase/thioredoxin n=1 Tax=Prosthecobacter dejongeii TaxID=48465 RepID=A0A7W7YK64_9BACT|nr:thioredoxin fold domain-containing protein [Prosthecobacter dejongeii]MBB5037395.1 thiol-disulfide isomerase/thioredoxin [Prosthecobacter dejongeii]